MIGFLKGNAPQQRLIYAASSFIGNINILGRDSNSRDRLSQEWAQGFMCVRASIIDRTKNLNIFDELK